MQKICVLLFSLLIITSIRSQNVGIGTASPQARLHVADSSVLFSATGDIPGTPGLPPVQGGGRRMMWYPDKAAFRVGYVNNTSWDNANIGNYSVALGKDNVAYGSASVAMGVNTGAIGNFSTAMGGSTVASGSSSTAMGGGTVASGNYSTAMGYTTTASGWYSTAMGFTTTAKAAGSVSTGYFNDISDNPGPGFPASADRIFQIGNGTSVASGSNALTVLRNGNMGIGTTNPRFPLSFNNNNGDKISLYDDGNPSQLHFGVGIFFGQLMQVHSATLFDDIAFGYGNSASFTEQMRIKGNGKVGIGTSSPSASLHVADSSVVFTAPASLPASPGNTPVSGAGNRMMWYADKASFRAGNIINDSWDKDKTGNVSFAAGSNTQASGITSTAFGNFAFAIGDISFAAGNSVFAKAKMSAAFGTYNDNTDNPNPAVESSTDRIFQIGNGAGNLTRSNALTVLRNSNVGIGTNNPAKQTEIIGPASAIPVTLVIGNKGGFGPAAVEFVSDYGGPAQWRPSYIRSNDAGGFTGSFEVYTNGSGSGNLYGAVKGLEVRNGVAYTATGTVSSFSDRRLKKNIEPFKHGLDVITRINPVSFNYNSASPFITDKKQIGIIAQELEQIAPYMVETNIQNGIVGLRSVNNQAYTFLLINAVKELQQQIINQQKQIDQLIKVIIK